MHNITTPPLRQTRNRRQLILHASRQQQLISSDRCSIVEVDGEPAVAGPGRGHRCVNYVGTVLGSFRSTPRQELQGVDALQSEEAVRGASPGIAGLAGIEHHYAPSRPR
jgi:hypothetical protein